MKSQLKAVLVLFFLPIIFLLHGQTFVPEENGLSIVSIDPNLSFPANYDQALDLLKESQLNNEQANALYYGQFALQLAKKNNDDNRSLRAIQNIARVYTNHGEYHTADSLYSFGLEQVIKPHNQAILYLNKAGLGTRTRDWGDTEMLLSKARELIGNDTLNKAMATYHFQTGVYEFEAKQNMVQSLVHYQEAKKIKAIEKRLIPIVNNNLSIIYSAVNDFEKARALNLENLAIALKSKDTNGELFAYYGLAFNAGMMEDDDGLLKYCQKAINLHQQTGVSTAFGYIYSLLGEYYIKHNQLDSAAFYLTKGVEISQAQGENKELVDCYQGLMNLYSAKNEDGLAIQYGEAGLDLGTRVDHNIEAPLAALYEKQGKYERAYELLHSSWQQQMMLKQNSSNVALMARLLEDRFEQERAQQSLKHQQTLSKQRNTLLVCALSTVIFLSFLIVFLQARSRNKLQELNNSLTESNEALRQFAYITSHDLKEPVRNITSFSGLLKRRLSKRENTEEENDFLNFITSNALVLKEIVDSLQIFTKISFGELQHENVPLCEVFETVENNLQQTIREVNGQLTIHNPEHVTKISFARHMLILVLQNLIQNGFKYNESNPPQVVVNVEPQAKGGVLFRVKDNGVGIEEEYFERIFTPFKTLKNKSVTQSSGLGLSICKTILERYGSSIHVSSDGQNGSTFSFVI